MVLACVGGGGASSAVGGTGFRPLGVFRGPCGLVPDNQAIHSFLPARLLDGYWWVLLSFPLFRMVSMVLQVPWCGWSD